MSSFNTHRLLFSLSIIFLSISNAQKLPKPKALLFPVKKDAKTLQYYTTLEISTKGIYIDVVLDLGAQFTWFNCDNYTLPTYRPIPCGSKKCEAAKGLGCAGCNLPRKPGCTNNTCGVLSYNPFTNSLYAEGLGEDLTFVKSTNGKLLLHIYESPNFPFSCSSSDLLRGLASVTKGIAGLANTSTALPTHLWSKFKLPNKFALCIPSSNELGFGSLFIGGGQYFFPPYTNDIARELILTPLVINPVGTGPVSTEGEPSDEYFIYVKSIKIDNKLVALNNSLLSISKNGDGGTKLSTIAPYTTLHSSIYKALIDDFVKAMRSRNIKRVASVAPFGACFRSEGVASTSNGPDVPYIDLVLPSNKYLRFYGANSMVAAKKNVLCFAFVDGGSKPKTSIVLGGHQLANYLIEFDIVSSKIGISASLLSKNSTCSQPRVL